MRNLVNLVLVVAMIATNWIPVGIYGYMNGYGFWGVFGLLIVASFIQKIIYTIYNIVNE